MQWVTSSLLDEGAPDPSLKDGQQRVAQVVGTFGLAVRLAVQLGEVPTKESGHHSKSSCASASANANGPSLFR